MSSTLPRVAQVGCGHWGKNLARNYAKLGVLVAVADDSPETARRIAAEYGVEVRRFEDVLDDDRISGISLATPAVTHSELALQAIEAGKHVFVEKPLALDPAAGQAVVEAAVRANRILMVGHLLHYHPLFVELKSMTRRGVLGTIHYLYSNRLSLGKVRTEENVLWSFAPHDISMILALTGEEPEQVTAQGAAVLNHEIADWSTCELVFPSGVRGHLQSAWLHPFKEHRLVVVGAKATAVFEDSAPHWDQRLAVYRHAVDPRSDSPVVVRAEPEFISIEPGEPLLAECQHFIDCMASGATPITDGHEGLRVLDVLSKAQTQLTRYLNHASSPPTGSMTDGLHRREP